MDVSQYLEIFIDESNEHLQSLSDQLMILEKEPENSDTINEIFRAAHSLKGMAGTMGYKRMQNLTHDMENVFSEVRNGNMKVTSDLVDVLFQCLDALEEYVNNIQETQDEGTNDNEPIIKALNAFIASENKDAAPAAEPVEIKTSESEEKVMTKTMHIEGMMCGHCEATVKKALEALPEVTSAEVSHEAGTAVVTLSSEVADDVLKKTVEEKDYKVTAID